MRLGIAPHAAMCGASPSHAFEDVPVRASAGLFLLQPPDWNIDYNKFAMPHYRIYRMKDSPRQQFRWAPHLSGCASLKPKEYEPRGEVEARHEYDAWQIMRETGEPIAVGDLLESDDGQLRICKYVGFEPAQWVLPEPRHPAPDAGGQPAESSVT